MTLKYKTWYKMKEENLKKLKNNFFSEKKIRKKINFFFLKKWKIVKKKNNAGKRAFF